MGWDFTQGATKNTIVDRLCADGRNADSEWFTSDHKQVFDGGTWVLWRVVQINTTGKPTKRFIACALLENKKGFGWGYKPMDEEMHPYYYSCPMEYLRMCPPVCEEWREGVRAYHGQR